MSVSDLSVTTLLLAAGCFAAALAGTGVVRRALLRLGAVDHPNERSSHRVATVTGGGLAVMGAFLAAWLAHVFLGGDAAGGAPIVGGALFLVILSLLDDFRNLSPLVRLAGHVMAVAAALHERPDLAGVLTPWIPAEASGLAVALAWIWFLNLYNFMDGIDGICGAETVSIALGFLIVTAALGIAGPLAAPALFIVAAAAGFLFWNWHPAKIFMGDVGSVPLGYLLGWLLLELAAAGHLAAALILPAYYLADASITLARRALRGEKIWRPHREHFYQRAHQRGLRHDQVVLRIAAANAGLIGLAAWAALGDPWLALAAAAAVVAALLRALARPAGSGA